VISLAVSMGANAAIVRAMMAVETGQLPIPSVNRLVIAGAVPPDGQVASRHASLADFVSWTNRDRVFEKTGFVTGGEPVFSADRSGLPATRIWGQSVTPEVFALLGGRPALGRLIDEADVRAFPARRVMVISDRLWRERYRADPAIVGRQVRVNGFDTTIIGVMAAGFLHPEERTNCWQPLAVNWGQPTATRWFLVLGLLKEGTSPAEAEALLGSRHTPGPAPSAADGPATSPARVRVQPIRDVLFGWTRPPLRTLQAAALLLFAMASVNVARLMLTQAPVRRQELGIRSALGASPRRLVQQVLAESLLVTIAGGFVGLAVAWTGLEALAAMGPPLGARRIVHTGFDISLLVVVGVFWLLSAMCCGVPASLSAGVWRARQTWRPVRRTASATAGRSRFAVALVGLQIAMALVLTIGATLLTTSYLRLANRPLNFRPEGLVSFELRVPTLRHIRTVGTYEGRNLVEIDREPLALMTRAIDSLTHLPGTELVAALSASPVNTIVLPKVRATVEPDAPRGGVHDKAARRFDAVYFVGTPNLFQTLGTTIVSGRDFTEGDTADAAWVVVINESLAYRFWPGENPIGRRLSLSLGPDVRPRTIVGVVRDIPTRRVELDATPIIYTPYVQQPTRWSEPGGGLFGAMTFLVRPIGDPAAVIRAAQQAVAAIDPDWPVVEIRGVNRKLNARMNDSRDYALALSGFALAVAFLAALGVYAATAQSVADRTAEIGLRQAIGATSAHVLGLIGAQATVAVLIGVVTGLAVAAATMPLLSPQLWSVAPTDTQSFALGVGWLAVVTALAWWLPARRALSVDLNVALRQDT
jgi:putative ABC transport system permease protein